MLNNKSEDRQPKTSTCSQLFDFSHFLFTNQQIRSPKSPNKTYELLNYVGQGSYGAVWRCRYASDINSPSFAIKVMNMDDENMSSDSPEKILKEIEIMRAAGEVMGHRCPELKEAFGGSLVNRQDANTKVTHISPAKFLLSG
jgi:serine/threonine protein kinase